MTQSDQNPGDPQVSPEVLQALRSFQRLHEETVALVQQISRRQIADRILLHALIQLHPAPDRLLEELLDRVDASADAVTSDDQAKEIGEALAPYVQHLSGITSQKGKRK